MRRTRADWKTLAKALLIFMLLMGFFLPVVALYQRFDYRVREAQAQFTAAQVGERLQQLLNIRVAMLNLLAARMPSPKPDGYANFESWAESIRHEIPDFYGLNWVNSDGVLTWVVPRSLTKGVAGRRLLDRADLRSYMQRSRRTKKAQITHIVRLYHGYAGLVIYRPLFADQRFEGWVTGVFAIDQLLNDFLANPEFRHAYFRLSVDAPSGTSYEHGTRPERGIIGRYGFSFLNQRFQVEVRQEPKAFVVSGLETLRGLLVSGIVLSSGIVALFAFMLMRSRERLRERLEKEHLQGVLLNLLVHDIVNPLLIIRFSADAAQRNATAEMQPHLDKIFYGIRKMNDVISRVKDMRAVELGKIHLNVEPVAVNEIMHDTELLFEQRFREKGVAAKFLRSPESPEILVDRVIFQNNVVNNIVSNAIKFSNPGGKVYMRAEAQPDGFVQLEISDEGIGMSPELLRNIFTENTDVTKPGTLGERGTGIGMLQVRSYMRIFGGRVDVTSRPRGQFPENHGTIFRLYLPRA